MLDVMGNMVAAVGRMVRYGTTQSMAQTSGLRVPPLSSACVCMCVCVKEGQYGVIADIHAMSAFVLRHFDALKVGSSYNQISWPSCLEQR